MLKGSIDEVHDGRCYGWAMDSGTAQPLEVEGFIDGRSIGHRLANVYRSDLEQAGLGGGRLAFDMDIPEDLRDGRHHRIEVRTVDGRTITARNGVQLLPRVTLGEFERHAMWVDADSATFSARMESQRVANKLDAMTATNLEFFRVHGWVKLPQAVPLALIDRCLADVDRAWHDLPPQLVWKRGLEQPATMGEVAGLPGFRDGSVRYLDFHNASAAAAEIMMLPAVLEFAQWCFGEPVAAMQSLLFENGSQQHDHQDFVYVHSLRPACLLGAWVALEDANLDSGPLFYWDRSHRAVPKYVFADGSVLLHGGYGPETQAFERYLADSCRALGLERLVFTPRKGDVLIWHSALVHGGMPRANPALTRKSMVSHYTTLAAYPFDRRSPQEPPLVIERNGGVYYAARREGHIEGRYALSPNTPAAQG